MNKRFLQLHLLTAYPPSNTNRDDLGQPKSAIVGGAKRLRISSQSLKRAWRTSELFEDNLKGNIGTRTRYMGKVIQDQLRKNNVKQSQANDWTKQILGVFGKVEENKKADPPTIELSQLVHFSEDEKNAIMELVETISERGSEATKEELQTITKRNKKAVDIALFGRMMASDPELNQEASTQVAHAITTHQIAIEDDYFTAVDDLNSGKEDRGSSHIGISNFSSGVFYTYICIDRKKLLSNLDGNDALAKKTIETLVKATATIAPSGKQNSFAALVRASFLMAELGNQTPRNLAIAFHSPVKTEGGVDVMELSIDALEKTKEKINSCYGDSSDAEIVLNINRDATATLDDIIQFSVSE